MITLERVLAATDFSDASRAALLWGHDLARKFGSQLHVLHVVNAFASQTPTTAPVQDRDAWRHELEVRTARELEAAGRSAENVRVAAVLAPDPGRAIVQYANDERIGLILVGTHGRQGLEHLLMGSVAEYVVRFATCPVLTVHRSM